MLQGVDVLQDLLSIAELLLVGQHASKLLHTASPRHHCFDGDSYGIKCSSEMMTLATTEDSSIRNDDKLPFQASQN